LTPRTINLKIEEAYQKLKSILNEQNCKIISETPQKQIIVRQGSLWGISPKTAKKTINITLESENEKTTLHYFSKLSSDWKNITIIGCILAFTLAAVCIWMALDLSAFMNTGNPSFWSWLVTAEGQAEFNAGEAFVNLAWGLATFLFVIIAMEAVVYAYVRSKIEAFATDVIVKLA